ncbi:MAG: S4 domain-containing protein [Salinivirgaceae bacterium]|jgi:ribosome-associated heat shock protein Hsp15|nr:S4 domain-containing protein [Salinivirgaceae bacterium]
MGEAEIRVDKWLWAVRVFKTRSQASEACKKGKVYLNGNVTKSSRVVKIGDVIEVKRSPVLHRFEVKELLKNRVGPKLVEKYLIDITPEQEVIKLDMVRMNLGGYRDRGAGRPTKKERRLIDNWQNSDE